MLKGKSQADIIYTHINGKDIQKIEVNSEQMAKIYLANRKAGK